MSDPSRFSHARWPSTGASRISSPAARSPAQPQVANSSPPSAQFAALPTTASAQLGAITQQVSYAVPMHSQGIHLTACGNACMNMLCDFYSKPDQIKPLPSIIAQPTGMTTDHIIAEMTSRGFIPSSVPLSHSTRQGWLDGRCFARGPAAQRPTACLHAHAFFRDSRDIRQYGAHQRSTVVQEPIHDRRAQPHPGSDRPGCAAEVPRTVGGRRALFLCRLLP